MTKKKFNFRTLCIVLTFIFLYMPIGVLVLYSFNSGDSTAVFQGFSLRWYKELFTDTATLNALKNTLILAVLSAVISTIFIIFFAFFDSSILFLPSARLETKSSTKIVTKISVESAYISGVTRFLVIE